MLFVERIARRQRSRELREDLCQEPVVQVKYCLAPVLPWPHQLDGDAVRIGIGVELLVAPKTADISFVREIDGDLGLVGDRMQ